MFTFCSFFRIHAEVNPSIENLYTVAQSLNGSNDTQLQADDPCLAEEQRTLREQQEILELDDIVE